jgi:hypothetical protein
LPELLAANEGTAPEVEVTYGAVPLELPDALVRGVRFQAGKDKLLLIVDEVARYLVEAGRRITIDRHPAADDDDIRVFLLGSAFGALLHQRDDLVLHGSVVAFGGECAAFLGRSGAGKSTLASAFRRRGHAVLTDDLCVVRPAADGRMLAYPGFPQTKLWLDSLQQLDLSADGLRRIRRQLEKRAVPLAEAFAREPLPIRKLFVLRPSEKQELKLTPVVGPQKFTLLKNQTYRFGFLAGTDDKVGHFQLALRLAQHAPLAIVQRPREPFRLEELVTLLAADLAG